MVVHLWVDPDADGPVQVGFTVSKAVGNAVTRNRVKRRLRHLTREHLQSLEGLPGRAPSVRQVVAPDPDGLVGRPQVGAFRRNPPCGRRRTPTVGGAGTSGGKKRPCGTPPKR